MKNRSYAVVLAAVVALTAASGASARVQFVHAYRLAPAKVIKHHSPGVRAARRGHDRFF